MRRHDKKHERNTKDILMKYEGMLINAKKYEGNTILRNINKHKSILIHTKENTKELLTTP